MIDAASEEFRAGWEAVVLACTITEAVQSDMARNGASKLDKEDDSPVTVADFASQAVICRRLVESFPEDSIVAEEDSNALGHSANHRALAQVTHYVNAVFRGASAADVTRWIDLGNGDANGRYWVLDPIDGTKGFLRGEQYAVALALIEAGAPRWSFLGCPHFPGSDGTLGRIFVAQQGGGAQECRLDGTLVGTVAVSRSKEIAGARMAESVEVMHKHHGLAHRVKVDLGMRLDSLLMDSQAKYAAVAAGAADVYLRAPNPRTPDYRENIWDHAAGWLLVIEGGGVVTDILGRPLDWSRGRRLEANVGIVASAPAFHVPVVDALQRAMRD